MTLTGGTGETLLLVSLYFFGKLGGLKPDIFVFRYDLFLAGKIH